MPIPRVKGELPLLGSALAFRKDQTALRRRFYEECGDIALWHMGPVPVISLTSAPLIHQLLTDLEPHTKKSRGLSQFGRPLLGNGLLLAEHDFHRRQRRLLGPAFAPKRIAAYADQMVSETEKLADTLVTGGVVDLSEAMMRGTLWIVGRTLFDIDLRGEEDRISDALTEAMEYMMDSISSPTLPYCWPTRHNNRMRHAVRVLDELVYRLIAERRKQGTDRGDVLSMLLLARDEDDGTGMTDAQVRDEALTLILAGHETTANALAWTWYLLGRHPEIYARVRAEVDSVLGDRSPRLADLERMPYTLATLRESMRLYPPAYVVGREFERDVVLGGHPIKKGQTVMAEISVMHRRPDYFPDPERFDPDRFGPSAPPIPKGAYLPFGAGPRVCIGNHFAMMEAHLMLATLVQRLEVSLVERATITPEPLVTLRPKNGVPARVSRREPRAPSSRATRP